MIIFIVIMDLKTTGQGDVDCIYVAYELPVDIHKTNEMLSLLADKTFYS